MALPVSCRFYERPLPAVGDIVLFHVTRVADAGVYGNLPEYDGKEALLMTSQITRRRIRSLHKLVHPGMRKCGAVTKVTGDYVDVSLVQVTDLDKVTFKERYAKAKEVNSILCHVGALLGYEPHRLEDLYDKTAWHLDRKHGTPGIGAYVGFRSSLADGSVLDGCDLEDATRTLLENYLARRLAAREVKVTSVVSVKCYTPEGIDAIKKALRAGLELSTGELPVNIHLITSPNFAVTLTTTDRPMGLKLCYDVMGRIQASIESSGGKFELTSPPDCHDVKDEAFDDSGYLSTSGYPEYNV